MACPSYRGRLLQIGSYTATNTAAVIQLESGFNLFDACLPHDLWFFACLKKAGVRIHCLLGLIDTIFMYCAVHYLDYGIMFLVILSDFLYLFKISCITLIHMPQD